MNDSDPTRDPDLDSTSAGDDLLDDGLRHLFRGSESRTDGSNSLVEALAGISGLDSRIRLRDLDDPDTRLDGPLSDKIRELLADQPRYDARGEIARGGIGIVLRAFDRDLGRDVAMKMLRPELADRPEMLSRFIEEAQIGGQLQHPGIVPV